MTEDEEFDKALGQLRFALNGVLRPLRMYGQAYYVDLATEEALSLAVQFYQKLSGIDEPYVVNYDKLNHDKALKPWEQS